MGCDAKVHERAAFLHTWKCSVTSILVSSCRAVLMLDSSVSNTVRTKKDICLLVWSLTQSKGPKLEQNYVFFLIFYFPEMGACIFCLPVLVKQMLTVSLKTILHMVIYINNLCCVCVSL